MEFHPVVVVVLSQLLTSLYGRVQFSSADIEEEAQLQQQVEDSIFGGRILQP